MAKDLTTYLQSRSAKGGMGQPPRNRQHGRPRAPEELGPEDHVKKATRLQRLYRENRRRAMEEVLTGPSPHCQVSAEEVSQYFQKMYSATALPVGEPYAWPEWPTDEEGELRDALVKPFSASEVAARLKRTHKSAPGPDGVTYDELGRADPGCSVLASVFNACLRTEAIPESWKSSTTVLTYKKGDRSDLSNWRPLALGDTVAKLFAAVLADRLMDFAVKGKRLSHPQKGFLKHEGCHEHNFMLREILEDSRREGRQAVVAWLDLTNAFGSIPHVTLFDAFEGAKIPLNIQKVMLSMNTGCTTRVRTSEGFTANIPMLAGVKQGCPCSPMTFNLAIERVIRSVESLPIGYRLGEDLHRAFAYADDIGLVAASPAEMQSLLDEIQRAAAAAGLKFNPKKCATVHLRGKGSAQKSQPTVFVLDGEGLKALGEGEAYEYLGIPVGSRVSQTPTATIIRMMEDANAIDSSLLAPWQKMDALRTFILPRLDYILRGGAVEKTPLKTFDKFVKRLVKGWMNLPQRASAEVVYLPTWRGGAGLIPMADLADVLTIAHAFRMLSCKDGAVAERARTSLMNAVRRRTSVQPTQEQVAAFLSGSLEGPFACDLQGDPGLWTRVRMASRRQVKRLHLAWRYDPLTKEILLECRGSEGRRTIIPPGATSQVTRRLRIAVQESYLCSLLAKPDQGKVFQVSSRSGVSNAFLRDGRYARFAEWRFIHRARLDVLPLNGARRWGSGDKRCRQCGYPSETLPHVICHCLPHSAALQLRHDAVMARVAKACRAKGAIQINRRVEGVSGDLAALRPDIVVRDEAAKRIHIIDVTVAFENQCKAMEDARRSKIVKYTPLAAALHASGYSVDVDAIVVGALGTWDQGNEPVLKRLGVSPRYAALMRRLIVTDTMRWSRDIYVEHVSKIRQYRDPFDAPAVTPQVGPLAGRSSPGLLPDQLPALIFH